MDEQVRPLSDDATPPTAVDPVELITAVCRLQLDDFAARAEDFVRREIRSEVYTTVRAAMRQYVREALQGELLRIEKSVSHKIDGVLDQCLTEFRGFLTRLDQDRGEAEWWRDGPPADDEE